MDSTIFLPRAASNYGASHEDDMEPSLRDFVLRWIDGDRLVYELGVDTAGTPVARYFPLVDRKGNGD